MQFKQSHIRKVFWTLFIGLPIFFGFLSYNWLPQEYDERNHILIESQSVECGPEGLNSCESPRVWRDRKTGKIFHANDFASHRRTEAFRISLLSFLYGLVACLFYAWDENVRDSKVFKEAIKYALSLNALLSLAIFILI